MRVGIISFALAAMAQEAEHILGKDEVTSSNLVSSLIKTPVHSKEWTGALFFILRKKINCNQYQ